MSFSKFRLGKSGQRTAPVPIAAALSRSAPEANNCAQHESAENKRRRVMGQKESSICTLPPSVSADRNIESAQTPYVRPPAPGKEGGQDIRTPEFISETKAPATSPMGVHDPGNSHSHLAPWRRRLDSMVNDFVSPGLAEQIFHQYIGKLVSTCPVVIFPPETTADYVRKTKPLLFMAILSVAPAGLCTPDQHKQFALEARGFLAEVAVLEGEKSLELVQALLIVSLWYRAPENYARTNQNQLASVTLSIAIDIALDRIAEPRLPERFHDKWNRTELQRTWLGCFLLCSSLSLIMRRPNPIPWSSRLKQYFHDLEQSKISPTDTFLCKILSMERVCHLADREFSLSDSIMSRRQRVPLSIMRGLLERVEGLDFDQHSSLEKALLEFGRQASILYIHELLLHVNHNIDEFKAPFSARSLKSYLFVDMEIPTLAYLALIRNIILAAQSLLDTFLGLSTFEMLSLPPHIYAGRVIYAVILLMKLHRALSIPRCKSSDDITVGELRLEEYIERLLLISKRLSTEDASSSLSRAFLIMPQLNEWLRSELENPEQSGVEVIRAEPASPAPAITNQTELSRGLPVDADTQVDTSQDHTNTLEALESQSGHPFSPDGFVENAGGNLSRELASDSWFWEFFNVDMLH